MGEGRLINKVSRTKSKPIAIGNNQHNLLSPPSLRQPYLIGLKFHTNATFDADRIIAVGGKGIIWTSWRWGTRT